MKKCKDAQLCVSRCKGILLAALSAFATIAFAQGTEVCQGIEYTIGNTVSASAGSEYRWVENGNVLSGTNQATYTVPADKPAGIYTYIRQSKSSECLDWQSSNEFTVTVFACTFTAGTTTAATATFTDPRDGKRYKTVVMPDGRTWFAQNLNYTKDLTYNPYASMANGKFYTSTDTTGGVLAIGSYWCPAVAGSTVSGSEEVCNTYGAIYDWHTAMMLDGKYSDETKTNSVWDHSWVQPYSFTSGSISTSPNADKNNGRGGNYTHGGGRGICPLGWHVPTILEWAILFDAVEGDGNNNIWQTSAPPTVNQVTDVANELSSSYTSNAPQPLGAWPVPSVPQTDPYGFGWFMIPHIDSRYGISYRVQKKSMMLSSTNYDRSSVVTTCYAPTMMEISGVPWPVAATIRCVLD